MNRTIALAAAVVLAAAPLAAEALAKEAAPSPSSPQAAGPQTYNMRDDASDWIKDPNVHAFYQATVDAFAQGPEHLDRAAYEKRSHEIFAALAVSRHMPPEAMQDHLKAIPGEMIQIVTRDPKTLATYDSFVMALFGPQARPGS
jgi:hypothetical protein